MDIQENKKEIEELLRSTKREGMEDVIKYMENNGFFTAPASAGHHLNTEGGLAQHSLNTCKAALTIWEGMQKVEKTLNTEVSRESVIISSLLHDLCKIDIYKKTTKKRQTITGWESSEGYKASYKEFPMGHGEKSLVLLLCEGLEMSDDEMLAIRWHMGAFGVNMTNYEDMRNFDAAKMKYPLVTIIQCADSIAAGIMERNGNEIDDM